MKTYANQIAGLLALTVIVAGYLLAPEAKLDRLGHALAALGSTTAGQMIYAALAALIVAVLRWALAKVPKSAAMLLVLCLASGVSGCGASALQQQAVYSTIGMRVEAAASDVVEAQAQADLDACPDVACVDALHEHYAPIVATLDSLRLALLAWGAAIATAAEADAGADVPTVVLDAARAALGLWPGVVSIAAQLGVTLPPLPPLLLALLGAAS